MKKPEKGQLVIETLRQFPDESTFSVARRIFGTFPAEFSSVENARDHVRYYRRSRGEKLRCADESFVPRIHVPAGATNEIQPFELPTVPAIISSDWHVPYHDQDALELMVEYMIERKIKSLLILGDGLDMYQVSHFSRDPTMFDVKYEVDLFNKILADIIAATGAKIFFKEGNHEIRFDHYLMSSSPEAYRFPQTRLRALMEPEKLDITYITDKQPIYFRGLTMLHGHELGKSANNPVSPARGLILRTKKSSVCGHWHRSSEQPANDIRGGQQTGWSIGCMCGLHPDYLPFNDWNHGFGELEADGEDFFNFANHKIIKGRIV